ncbi:MAG: hypothetical protein K2N51_17110 [Lachnospiraceae bacterium]|nr:hypothetical protein [Lachnospiraceae bacterium]
MPTGKEKLLTIDGETFEIYLIKLEREVSLLDKAAHRTLNGDLHREVIGTYVNYNLEFGYSDRPERYDRLWQKLSEPVAFHRIRLPKNVGYTSEFLAYIAQVKDNIEYANPDDGYKRRFKGLSCSIVSKSPNIGNHK